MIGLILAAGEGKRLNSGLNKKTVKPLVKINHKYLIEYSLKNCFDAGIKKIIIVVSTDNKEEFVSAIGNDYYGMEIIYAVQPSPKGLINAVLSACDYLNDNVLLQLSDEIFVNPEIKNCIDEFNKGSDFIVTCVYEQDEGKIRKNFSIETDEKNRVVNCIEKPQKAINSLKGTGLCLFSSDCIELLKKGYNSDANFPDNLCDCFNFLIKEQKIGKAFCIAEEEININTVSGLDYAQMKIRDEKTQ